MNKRKTAISYLDDHLPLNTGCTKCSKACTICHAAKTAATRVKHHPYYKGLAYRKGDGSYNWSGEIRNNLDCLKKVTGRGRPKVYGVSFTGDLMLASDEAIDALIETCRLYGQHTLIFTTKRPELLHRLGDDIPRNLWPGVSVWDQPSLEAAIYHLKSVSAEVKWLSEEPCLGPLVHGTLLELAGIKLVVLGCESGKGARPMEIDWVRQIRDDCEEADVCFYFKQAMIDGELVHAPKLDGRQWQEWPEVAA